MKKLISAVLAVSALFLTSCGSESKIYEPEPIETEIYDGATITFEDGNLWTAQSVNDYNYEDDESECALSVVDYGGSNRLKIEVLSKSDDGNYKVPKIKFDVDKLVGIDNVSKICYVTADITAAANGTFTADNGEEILVPGNCIGEIDANSGEECEVWATFTKFSFEEWEKPAVSKHIEGKILIPKARYVDGEDKCTLIFMRWPIPNQADMYLDNITFYDDDRNPIPLVYNPATDEEVYETDEFTYSTESSIT